MQSTSGLTTPYTSESTETITPEVEQKSSEDPIKHTKPSVSNREKTPSPLDNPPFVPENSVSSKTKTDPLRSIASTSKEDGNSTSFWNNDNHHYHTVEENEYQHSKIPSKTNDANYEAKITTHVTTDDITESEYLFNLGAAYFFGDGVEMNPTQAFNYIRMAAEKGHVSAQYNLGSMYNQGLGVDKNFIKAAEWIEKAALKGDINAQCALGDFYILGLGVDQNSSEAFEWHLKAALQGHAVAQFNVGEMYNQGEGVDQHSSKAFEWYFKAALQGHAVAQFNVGEMYDQGEGVDQNSREAFGWYMKAAQQGYKEAQFELGKVYKLGKGVDQNSNEAFDWYLKAAKQDHVNAQFNLGLMYYQGKGVDKNISEAFGWYLKAALQGHAVAQFNVGVMYDQGKGVYKNSSEAFGWSLKAAQQGYKEAQFNVGLMYYQGKGVDKNSEEAIKWFQMAAVQGEAAAQFILGSMYKDGDGKNKDLVKAADWLLKAAEANLQKAQLALAKFNVMHKTGSQDLFNAVYWLLRSGLSADKTILSISLEDFSEVIALIPSALNEYKEFAKVSSIEFTKIPKEVQGKMGPIFAELMQSNSNLTSLKAPNYVIDDNEAQLIKKSLDINTDFNEVALNYTQLDNAKSSFDNIKKMVWNTLPNFLKFDNSIKKQLLDAIKFNQTIFELRNHLKKRRDKIEEFPLPIFFDAIPWDILMKLGDEIIIRSLKSGFSKEATLIALDEFLLSVHADGIRINKAITNS